MNNLLSHLRLADLELFITAGHLKSLGKAATLHNLSQSAASTAITRVEQAFGMALCTHEKRQFRLTYEGASLLPAAENWLREFREKIATSSPRPIRIATTQAIARAVISSILPIEIIDLKLMRPDHAYNAVLNDAADIALVPDNSPWDGVDSVEVGTGLFQLYSMLEDAPVAPVLLPENQIEVLCLLQRWKQLHGLPLEIKARIPSWSLIADICTHSIDVGFLPDFLGQKAKLHPVAWQPEPSSYRILALFHSFKATSKRIDMLLECFKKVFNG
jgi:DNA-binding transcriptional LysR family regulator